MDDYPPKPKPPPPGRYRARMPSIHDPAERRHREKAPSIHDLVEAAKEELREEFREEITASHWIPPPVEPRSARETSSPPGLRWAQKKWWTISVAGVSIAAATTVAIVATTMVKDCQFAIERAHQGAAPK